MNCAVLSRSVRSDSLRPHELQPSSLLCPWGFSRQDYRSGLPFPSPGDLPNPGIEPQSPVLQADSLLTKPPGKPKNSGVSSFPSPGDLPNPGIEPGSPALQVDSLPADLPGKPRIVCIYLNIYISPLPLEPPHLLYLKALCKQPSDISCDSRCWCTRLDIVFLHIYLHFTLNNSNKRSTFVAPPFI